MDSNDLFYLHETTCKAALETMKKKNHDYAYGDDPFANFKGSEFLNVPIVISVLMRSMDKFKRIETFVRSGKLEVVGEGVDDSIEDVINYMILIKGIIIAMQEAANEARVEYCSICGLKITAGEELVVSFNTVGLLFDHIDCVNRVTEEKNRRMIQ